MGRRQTYLGQNHGGDFLGREDLALTKILDLNHRASILVNNLEWPRLDILLDGLDVAVRIARCELKGEIL